MLSLLNKKLINEHSAKNATKRHLALDAARAYASQMNTILENLFIAVNNVGCCTFVCLCSNAAICYTSSTEKRQCRSDRCHRPFCCLQPGTLAGFWFSPQKLSEQEKQIGEWQLYGKTQPEDF